MMQRVVVVEDEKDLMKLVAYNLRQAGYAVEPVLTGEEALEAVARARPDLMILDLMLPGISGLEVCRRLKSEPETREVPVLILTARGHEMDRIAGFELGADDYVTKPFSVRELVLRVSAILRRSEGRPDAGSAPLAVGSIRIDRTAHRVTVEGKEILLTPIEFKLLVTLLSRRGRLQSRETLLRDVWDLPSDVATRTVDAHMKRLREKLGTAGEVIETVRGFGYRCRAGTGPEP
jgi:two-component system phosphate regulon response regulator PhoB